MNAPSAAADQRAAGAPPDADPVAAGRRLAASVPRPHANGHEPVEALARASLPLLRDMGVIAEIVRARRDCLVVRSSARDSGKAAEACVMVGAWLEALPSVAYGVSGTVAESSCALRGGHACIHALMWRATDAGFSLLAPRDVPAAVASQPGAQGEPASTPPAPAAESGSPVASAPDVPAIPLQRTTPAAVVAPVVPRAPKPSPVPTQRTATRRLESARAGEAGHPLRARVRAASERWPWIRRRGWLVAVCVLAGALGGLVAGSVEPQRYQATAVVVVQSSASTAAAASANGAEELAVTYAALVPDDQSLLAHVGAEIGVPALTVGHDLSVQAVSGTALIDVRFTTSRSTRAVTGANDVARALTGVRAGSAIAPGTVSEVSPARSATPSGSLRHYGLPIGLLLGVVVGCGAALIAERSDRRIDDVDTLGEAARCPATKRPGGMSPAELVRAIERTSAGPLTVVPLERAQVGKAVDLCRSIAGTKAEPVVRMSTPLVTAPTSCADEGGPTVLVVGAGSRMKVVEDAVTRLRVLGRAPAWAVLVPPARRARQDGR